MAFCSFFSVKLSHHLTADHHIDDSESAHLINPKRKLLNKIDRLDRAAFYLQAGTVCLTSILQGIKLAKDSETNLTFDTVINYLFIFLPPLMVFTAAVLINERNNVLKEIKEQNSEGPSIT